MAGLADKQQRFVDEYLIDLNATQAAIRAGYSANNADKIVSELLGKTGVAEAIQDELKVRVISTCGYFLFGKKTIFLGSCRVTCRSLSITAHRFIPHWIRKSLELLPVDLRVI